MREKPSRQCECLRQRQCREFRRTIRFALVRFPSRPGSPPLATAIDQFPGCPKSWVSHRSPIYRASSRLFAWVVPETPMWQLLQPPRTPARRLRRCAASSFIVGSRRGRTVRAAGSLGRVARLLTVVAFIRCVRRGTVDPDRVPRRPPTSRAHRLRKPDLTREFLALYVARWTRWRGLLPAASRAPRRVGSSRGAPFRGRHVGTPSITPGPSLPPSV